MVFKTAVSLSIDNLKSHPYNLISMWKSKQELAAHLLKNIVYHDNGVLAVNKPYGVGVSNIPDVKDLRKELALRQGKYDWHNPPKPKELDSSLNSLYQSRGVPLSPYTLEDVLPILRSELKLESLDVVKSTEKFSSGVAVFAENRAVDEELKLSYKSAKSNKIKNFSFLVITSLIPQLDNVCVKETVAINTKEVQFKNKILKVPIIERNFSNNKMKRRDIVPVQAEVQTHSMNSVVNAALMEIRTTVTKSHFLRIYSADMLMPVLGDHIFSNRVQALMGVPIAVNPLSVEPGSTQQKLSKDILERLDINRKEDAIIIPLHSHLVSLTYPNFFKKNKHLVISAPPPTYFRWTCRRLKLNLDSAFNVNNTETESDQHRQESVI